MRLGVRLQLLLALGALFVLGFVPLHFAVASLARRTLLTSRESTSRALGRAVAAHVAESVTSPDADVGALLDAQLSDEAVAAIGLYDPEGKRSGAAGYPGSSEGLPAQVAPRTEAVRAITTPRGSALLVLVPASEGNERLVGSIAVVVRTDPATTPTAPLVRLVAAYVAFVGVVLLLFAYFVVTRLVVRPVDRLARAAARVAGGARTFDLAPRSRAGGAELATLEESLSTMTSALRAEEEALRAKVAEVEEATRRLREAQEGLVRSERLASVGRLSAGLAHEVGNPLAAIQGLLELLEAGDLADDERADFVRRARKETERIHQVLRGLLDFTRPVRAARPGEHARGSLGDAAEAVRGLLRPQRTLKDVELSFDVAGDLPAVPIATGELEQILLNLLLNAGDALDGEGRVEVRARVEGGAVVLTVDDDGPGIDPEVAGKLFEPFVTTKEVGKGTGLGLAVTRGIVEAAGGAIAAEPSPLGGARFRIVIPTAAPARE